MKKLQSLLSMIRHSLLSQYEMVRIKSDRDFMQVWNSINCVQGHLVSPYQEHWLFHTCKELPDGANILEIGSYKGRSTISLAYACQGSNKHIYAVDTFNGNDSDFLERNFYNDFQNNLRSRSLSGFVTPVKCFSYEAAKNWDKPIHFLFIDGSHEYEDVIQDFELFFPFVINNGIVALHDVVYTWEGPTRAWEEKIKRQLRNVGACKTLAYGRK